jgi:hypothetical protein
MISQPSFDNGPKTELCFIKFNRNQKGIIEIMAEIPDSLKMVLVFGASGLGVMVFIGIYTWWKEKNEEKTIVRSRSSHKSRRRHHRRG